VFEAAFFDDLAKKDTVIILKDLNENIRGFTSSMLFSIYIDDEELKILYSGDTIIHPDFWGSLELPRLWGQFMLNTIDNIGKTKLFWFLISSGYKTYRFLPAYFHKFYPRYNEQTPDEMQHISNVAADHLFADKYNANTGIIKLEQPTPLKDGISDPTEQNLKNPHISFFIEKNPGYINGEELACLTKLTIDNIKPFVKRLLKV